MKEKDKKRLYGQLLVDFANSRSTDDAGLTYLANLQNVFDFSPEFATQAQRIFPRQDLLIPSDPEENRLMMLMIQEKKLKSEINRYMEFAEFEGFDNVDQALLIKEVEYFDEREGGPCLGPIEKYYLKDLSREVLGELCKHLIWEHEEYEEKILFDARTAINNYVQTVNDLVTSKQKITQATYSMIEESTAKFLKCQNEHTHILDLQNKLKTLFQAIIDVDTALIWKTIGGFINVYNASPKSKVIIADDGKIIIKERYQEDIFLSRNEDDVPRVNRTVYYDYPISYCIVEFFKHEMCRKLVKKCENENCLKFFIARKLIDEQKFCPGSKCRMEHHNKVRIQSGVNALYKRERRKQGKDQ